MGFHRSHHNFGLTHFNWCCVFHVILPTEPAQITMFSIPTITNASIRIHWVDPEGINNGYRVTITPAEGVLTYINEPDNPGASVTMLTPGKMYNVSVYTLSGLMESSPTQYSFTTQSYSK